jgi:hypothetical protein
MMLVPQVPNGSEPAHRIRLGACAEYSIREGVAIFAGFIPDIGERHCATHSDAYASTTGAPARPCRARYQEWAI